MPSDGVCVLCSRWFVAARDRAARFRFTAMQDPLGRRLAATLGIDPADPGTNAVVSDGIAYLKSGAGIAVLSHLPARVSRATCACCRGRRGTGYTTAWRETVTACPAAARSACCRMRACAATQPSERARIVLVLPDLRLR